MRCHPEPTPAANFRPVATAALAAAALAAALLLSGCGSPDLPGAAPPGSPPATTSPAGSPEPPPGASQPAPTQAPESLQFTATTVAGETFDAADLAGKPVVFWFWAPWCPRCVAAAPEVLALSADVTVIGVGGLAGAGDMQGFIDRTGTAGMIHLSDPDGVVWGRFGVTAQETVVVIDANGEIVHNGALDPAHLRQRLDELG